MEEPLPSRIGRYEIREEIGRGAMGVVYKAEDPVLGRLVAVKTIQIAFAVSEKEQEAFGQRFLAEARAAARLSHPGLVVVFDVGMDRRSGKLFMALEYLEGQTLDRRLQSGPPLDWTESLHITARLAEALHHAHSQGIIHRDVKPANIMLLHSGEPKVMDFGIAKLAATQLTTSGQAFGSPSYMSPERALDQGLDHRSDLFSLGAVLYEMLTGTKAFSGPDIPSILMRVAYEEPAPPSLVLQGRTPRELDGVIARILCKVPAERYADGRSFAEDLQDLLDGRSPRHHESLPPIVADRGTIPKASTLPAPEPPSGPEPPADPEPPAETKPPAEPKPPRAPGADTSRPAKGKGLAFPPGKRVSLAILAGARQGEVFGLTRPQAVIGRAGGRGGADIEIPDPEVSRMHAAVECHGSRIVLRDLESRNGTFVGIDRIGEQEIEDRGEFRVGQTRFMLIVADLE